MISKFQNAFSTNPQNVGLQSVLDEIRTGAHAEKVAAIRAIRSGVVPPNLTQIVQTVRVATPIAKRTALDAAHAAFLSDPNPQEGRKALADFIKRSLPAVTPTGTFTSHANASLVQHSGFVVVDFDHIANPEAQRDSVGTDQHVRAAFVSPSGDGLKVLVKIPVCSTNAEHGRAFDAAVAYFNTHYGLNADPSGRDVSRFCFLSWDPGLRENLEPVPIEVPPEAPEQLEVEPSLEGIDGAVVLPGHGVSITAAATRIVERLVPLKSLFYRGGQIVELTEKDGVTTLSPVSPKSFRSRIEKLGTVMALRSGRGGKSVLAPVTCSTDIADAILNCSALQTLPRIESLHQSPVLVVEGAEVKVLGKGWHSCGKFVLGGSEPVSMQLPEAVALLHEVVADFDFVEQGDKARAVCALLLPALVSGNFISGPHPIIAVEADCSQAGKGYLISLIAEIYDEPISFVSQSTGGVGSFDEKIAHSLIAGRQLVSLDNLRGKLASAMLESLVTAQAPFPCRVPYRGIQEVDTSAYIFALSSNGFEGTPDIANRSCIVRIKKRPPGFPYRTYDEGFILDHIGPNRSRFLGAVHSVLNAWIQAGQPKTTEADHDFRGWCRIVDWISRELLSTGPVMQGHNVAKLRVSDPAISWIRGLAVSIESDSRLGDEFWASELYDVSGDHGLEVPGVRPGSETSVAAPLIGRVMGRLFRTVANDLGQLEVEGHFVSRIERENVGYSGTSYRYVFSKSNP